MKMIVISTLISIFAGGAMGIIAALCVLRCWVVQEEERRRRMKKAARLKMKEARETAVRHADEETKSSPESTIALFPVERVSKGRGCIRGAYRGPDGVVTYVGMEGAGADV